jgi:hypothetical protein
MKRAIGLSLLAGPVLLICSVSAQDRKEDQRRPDLALWAGLKRSLTDRNGEEYFQQNVKDAAIPVLVGTLISATPADRPSVLVIGISDPSTPEVTLRLKGDDGKDAHLNGPVTPGSQIRFEGVAREFTKDPFMLTFETLPSFKKPRGR